MRVPTMAGHGRLTYAVAKAPAPAHRMNAVTDTLFFEAYSNSKFLMFSAPSRAFAQLLNEIVQCEPSRSGPRNRILCNLRQLLFPLGAAALDFLRADEGPRPLLRLEQSAELELAVGANHGVGIDGEIDGKLAHRGQLIARGERTRRDSAACLIDNLPVDRHAAVQVEPELKSS